MLRRPLFPILGAITLIAAFTACVKTDFDQPPTGGEPVDIEANTTIAYLRSLHVTPGGIDSVREDLVIEGVVVMDDKSGNFYKALVIEDSTAGIEVRFNDPDQYTRFPIGRTIYIRCKDLLLTDYAGLVQLSGSVTLEGGELRDFGLTEAQVRTKVVGGTFGDDPVPTVRKINQLGSGDISTLIRLDDVEFISADTGRTYADPITQNSLNRILVDCDGNELILRTSGFADFAAELIPGGKGSIVGVLGVFNDDLQLYIRDLNDVNMDSLRCGEIVVPPNGLESLNENFEGIPTGSNQYIDLGGWVNMAYSGTERWEGRDFSGNSFAQASAFQAPVSNLTTWLITPALDLRTQKSFSMRTQWGFYAHQGLTVWYSTDFNGSNAETANWIQMSPKLADANTPLEAGSNSYCEWVGTGSYPLPVVSDKPVYIGFKYEGNTSSNTTNWRIDDVIVE